MVYRGVYSAQWYSVRELSSHISMQVFKLDTADRNGPSHEQQESCQKHRLLCFHSTYPLYHNLPCQCEKNMDCKADILPYSLSSGPVPSDIIYMSHTLFGTSPRLSATHTSWYKSAQIDAQICCSPKEDKAKTLCPRQLAASNIERFTDAVLSCEDKWEWKTQLSVN